MILYIDACVRKESRTRKLADALLDAISSERDEVVKEKLSEFQIGPLDAAKLSIRDEAIQTHDFTDGYFEEAKRFASADTIIMAAPYWDLSFPASLKQYLEHICINGITFRYTEEGIPQGLCRAKKLYYVTTAGGEIGKLNFGYDYVKGLCQYILGIEDTRCIRAVGLDMQGVNAQEVMQNAINHIKYYYGAGNPH